MRVEQAFMTAPLQAKHVQAAGVYVSLQSLPFITWIAPTAHSLTHFTPHPPVDAVQPVLDVLRQHSSMHKQAAANL